MSAFCDVKAAAAPPSFRRQGVRGRRGATDPRKAKDGRSATAVGDASGWQLVLARRTVGIDGFLSRWFRREPRIAPAMPKRRGPRQCTLYCAP